MPDAKGKVSREYLGKKKEKRVYMLDQRQSFGQLVVDVHARQTKLIKDTRISKICAVFLGLYFATPYGINTLSPLHALAEWNFRRERPLAMNWT